jgi:hypothetical protein
MTVHFYLTEPRIQAIPAVPFKVAFLSVNSGVLTETVKLLVAFLSLLGFRICHWQQQLNVSAFSV